MSITLRILLLLAAAITVVWILYKIRRLKVKMEDSIFWIFFAGILCLLGLFPEIVYAFTNLIGIISPANFIFLVVIIILLEKVFTLSIIVSQLEEKITILSAEVALRSHEMEKKYEGKSAIESSETGIKEKKDTDVQEKEDADVSLQK